MAYPTGMLAIVLEDIDRRLSRLKSQVQIVRDASAAGNLASSRILDLFIQLKNERVGLVTAAATPGIGSFAQAQKNQPGLDVVAEFNAVITTVDGVTDWIGTNFPKDGSGFLLSQTLGAFGPVDRVFTPVQLVTFRTQLDNLLATIA